MHPLLEGARPRTLPAAVAPVLVGTALALDVRVVRAVLAMIVALALQVAVNYANDYFDGVGGIDTEQRTGPRRMVASGLVEPSTMKRAIAVALLVAGVAGLLLSAIVSWWLLAVGAAAGLAALGYSGGSRPYASMGLGELFVFVFFGLVATAGTTYVQDEAFALAPVVAGVVMGALATALLVVNNLRDIPTDEATGKRTLAVRIGEQATRRLWGRLVLLALGAHVALVATVVRTGLVGVEGWALLVAAFPVLALLREPRTVVMTTPLGRTLVPVLEATARAQLLYAVLLTAGLVAARWIGGGGVVGS